MTEQVYGYQGPDELPRRPTPKQVRDFYDVHTDIGTVNFSNANDGLSLELWHALNLAVAEIERLRFAAKQALMALEEGYDAPKIHDDLKNALQGGDDE